MKNDLGKVDGRDKHQEDKKIKINKKLKNILLTVPLAISPGSSLAYYLLFCGAVLPIKGIFIKGKIVHFFGK